MGRLARTEKVADIDAMAIALLGTSRFNDIVPNALFPRISQLALK
jgi:hypothetical protein